MKRREFVKVSLLAAAGVVAAKHLPREQIVGDTPGAATEITTVLGVVTEITSTTITVTYTGHVTIRPGVRTLPAMRKEAAQFPREMQGEIVFNRAHHDVPQWKLGDRVTLQMSMS